MVFFTAGLNALADFLLGIVVGCLIGIAIGFRPATTAAPVAATVAAPAAVPAATPAAPALAMPSPHNDFITIYITKEKVQRGCEGDVASIELTKG